MEDANIEKAIQRVVSNKGSGGVDKMQVAEVRTHFARHWSYLKKLIMEGHYSPQAVKRVEIPKDNGKKRGLGIPTVTDRVIQQAIVQVLTPIFEPQFSDNSYGFRPRRNAHQAVKKVVDYANEGYRYTVDLDLEKYFDTVNHSRLIQILSQTIKDGRVVSLIHKYLNAGVVVNRKKRHIENLIFATECIRYVSETESEQLWFDISSFDNNIDHFAQDTFIGDDDNNLKEQETEKFVKRFVAKFRKMNLDKEVKTSYEIIFSLKKVMEYGPKSQEVQYIFEQIFNCYGIASNKLAFILDNVLLMYRIIRIFSIDRIILMLFEKPDATNLMESALSKFVVDRKKGGNVDG
ncbi:reverse transcriptase domain-containing protein [Thomasclavelia spiroformis]|uniref:reverse transcriptase domain-containing protein n=1 Tax=Thomasclavelia spiroformis TaxID=29348 RepID=UPI00241D747A|nr:reverse transcriptase domain-containing protein [Thomasclavelia spiroformis]